MTNWTAADIPRLSGMTALVTGATSGIGYHTALQLAAHGAHVLLGARAPDRADRAVAGIRAAVPAAKVDPVLADLADLTAVRDAAAGVLAAHDHIDLLINNAGEKFVARRRVTRDGFETQFGTNHLGHFALTGLLLPALLRRAGARVVTMTSIAHRLFGMDFDDPQHARRYSASRAYGRSKLATLLFALELDRRLHGHGGAISLAAHPGIATEPVPRSLGRLIVQSMADGALPSLYAATSPTVEGGQLYGPGNLVRTKGSPRLERPSARARDAAAGRRLWDLSETLTGVRYDFARP
ncbi:MAG: SDR family NAD(P)-dependent oxidoreductase [Kutzneria sp.]|nr:SDR family NAD(P)-dependent oxidoreductase [Kutzneria sp.]MBV9844517.1 SDR family NAD(P)-dependent oxidoreductase [Kutzneria sp.]